MPVAKQQDAKSGIIMHHLHRNETLGMMKNFISLKTLRSKDSSLFSAEICSLTQLPVRRCPMASA